MALLEKPAGLGPNWAVGLALVAEGLGCAAGGIAAAAILARSIGV